MDALTSLAWNPAAPPEVKARLRPASSDPDSVQYQIDRGLPVGVCELEAYAGAAGLAGLAVHDDPKVRAALGHGWWMDMPEAIRRALLADPDPSVRASVAGHPHGPVPEDLHTQLLADEATREHLACYATLTREIALQLLDGDEELRGEVARNPTLPADLRDRLAHDSSPYVRGQLILRQDLPEDQRNDLYLALKADAGDPLGEAAFALTMVNASPVDWLDALPLAERLTYLSSPVYALRAAVARSKDLPASVAAELDDDPSIRIRRVVAHRPGTPGPVLERLVVEHGEDIKGRPLLVQHPNFPPDGHIRLARSAEPRLRALAPNGPDLPVPILVELAKDTDASVRAAAAEHARLPAEILAVLVGDPESAVSLAAGGNPNLPVPVMLRLLEQAGL